MRYLGQEFTKKINVEMILENYVHMGRFSWWGVRI
jgi:hypothetical protein